MKTDQFFPWYDSNWLSSYVRAKHFLSKNLPEKLSGFCEAFEILRTPPDYQIKMVSDLFSVAQHQGLVDLIRGLNSDQVERHELFRFGRTIAHDHALLNQLQESLTNRVSELVNEEVEPCYNFLSLYNNLGVCKPHMDAPSAKWTVDYCIEHSAPWPIYFSQVTDWPENWQQNAQEDWEEQIKSDPKNHFSAYLLQERQAIIFAGSSQWHYRERIAQQQKNNFCHLAFFHFIPKGTRSLTRPSSWAELFDIPELDGLVIKPQTIDTHTPML